MYKSMKVRGIGYTIEKIMEKEDVTSIQIGDDGYIDESTIKKDFERSIIESMESVRISSLYKSVQLFYVGKKIIIYINPLLHGNDKRRLRGFFETYTSRLRR